jgi:hypothetical protein
MKTFLPKSGFLTIVFFIASLFFANVSFGQTVTLDQADLDYFPGETVYITGTGWQPNEVINLQVDHLTEPIPDHGTPNPHLPWTIVADDSGNFDASWFVTEYELGSNLLLIADGVESGFTYEVFFTDAIQTISSILPSASGSTNGGYTITITTSANAFTTGLSPYTVSFGGTFGTSAARTSNTTLTVFVPVHSAGAVTITIYDKNSNIAAQSGTNFTFNCPTITSTITKTSYNGADLSCNTSSNGVITITAPSGGTGTYTYSKNNGSSYQTANVFSGLAVGTYQMVLRDINNCTSTATSVTITAPTAISASGAVTSDYNGSQLSCATATDGKITVTASGGTGTLTYAIDGGLYQASNEFTGLAAGSHTLSVKDANACTFAPTSVTITAPTTLSASISTNNPTLYFGYSGDQTATITATPSGGTAPYTIKITMVNGNTPAVAPAAVRVNGKLICNFINSAGKETWTPALTTNPVLSKGITCATNLIDAESSSTSNPINGSYSVNVTLLADARFIATVTDANGCSYTTLYADAAKVDAEDARCFAGNSGNAKVTLCHQTSSAKNPCVAICVDQSAVQEHLNHGDFLGKCTTNCKAPVSNAKLSEPDKIVVVSTNVESTGLVVSDLHSLADHNEAIIEPAEFMVIVYPNPTDDQFTLVLEGGSDEKVEVLVYDMLARKVKRIEKNSGLPIVFGEEFPVGEYLVLVRQGANAKALNLIKK